MDNTKTEEYRRLWRDTLEALRAELPQLAGSERAWMEDRLTQVGRCQQQLQALFAQAGGEGLCRSCAGACCQCGTHHLTLVNLLAFLLPGAPPPAPDFDRTCPFLAATGCRLPATHRPFNCVTFICEPVEAGLTAADRKAFWSLERRLRALYEAFDRRYAGSSLRGLLIRAERLGGRAFLERI
jgi:hypothetical protein